MALDTFIDNLRLADRMLAPQWVSSGMNSQLEAYYRSMLHSSDQWLTAKVVDGFDPSDFGDWPNQDREELKTAIASFLAIAQQVPANKPATKGQSKDARKHLERVLELVRKHLLVSWLEAQKEMVKEAIAAAKVKGWFVEEDQKEVSESLLGSYQAPRLRIKNVNTEVVLDPIARFGSGRRGIVDLVVMPTYETAYAVVYNDGAWEIVSSRGTQNTRPFSQMTLVNTITKLAR